MKSFKLICFLLCTVFIVACGIQKKSSEKQNDEVKIEQIYIYQKNGYEKIDTQEELGVKIKEFTNKILKESSTVLELIDGSVRWGKVDGERKIKDEEWYVEVIFEEKEKINLTDECSYENITGMLVDINESAIYLSQDADVVESGSFCIGLAVPFDLMEACFSERLLNGMRSSLDKMRASFRKNEYDFNIRILL